MNRVDVVSGLGYGQAEHVAFFLSGLGIPDVQYHSHAAGGGFSVSAPAERLDEAKAALKKAGFGL